MATSKVISIHRNRETAAASDWQTVAEPIARLILTADYLRHDALPDAAMIALGAIANHARNALALNGEVRQDGYHPTIDDSIVKLAERADSQVTILAVYIHPTFHRFLREACVDLKRAAETRKLTRAIGRERTARA